MCRGCQSRAPWRKRSRGCRPRDHGTQRQQNHGNSQRIGHPFGATHRCLADQPPDSDCQKPRLDLGVRQQHRPDHSSGDGHPDRKHHSAPHIGGSRRSRLGRGSLRSWFPHWLRVGVDRRAGWTLDLHLSDLDLSDLDGGEPGLLVAEHAARGICGDQLAAVGAIGESVGFGDGRITSPGGRFRVFEGVLRLAQHLLAWAQPRLVFCHVSPVHPHYGRGAGSGAIDLLDSRRQQKQRAHHRRTCRPTSWPESFCGHRTSI